MSQETNATSPSPTREVSSTPPPTHPAQHGHRPAVSAQYPATLVPEAGWHFLHLFYKVDRRVLAELPAEARLRGRQELVHALDRSVPGAPDQSQGFAVPGHKADFGVMLAGADLKSIHVVQ